MINMKKIAIVGGGIVGLCTAYYLTKEKDLEVSLFDDGKQATKAAVGIVCPWLNQRRNKFWYELVKEGAEFYDKLINDLGIDSFYHQVGGLYINPKMQDKIYKIVKKRANESYKVGEVIKVNSIDNSNLTPKGFKWDTGIFVSGAARVDGAVLLDTLLDASIKQGLNYNSKNVSITERGGNYEIDHDLFDCVVLTPGPHLKDLMKFKPEYSVDVHSQKGQLISFNLKDKNKYPVIMPKGELDFLFGENGQLIIGASHENEYSDRNVDWSILEQLKKQALKYFPSLIEESIDGYRVGFRAHNSTFTPFYGNLKDDPNIFVASGLGSSGLTSGPIIAYRIAQGVIGLNKELKEKYNANKYVSKG